MLRYLSLDINYLFFESPFLGTENARGQISEHILAQNGGYCLRAKLCSQLVKSPPNSRLKHMAYQSIFFLTEIREEQLEVVTPIVEELGKSNVQD